MHHATLNDALGYNDQVFLLGKAHSNGFGPDYPRILGTFMVILFVLLFVMFVVFVGCDPSNSLLMDLDCFSSTTFIFCCLDLIGG
jgi:hypothetical protein